MIYCTSLIAVAEMRGVFIYCFLCFLSLWPAGRAEQVSGAARTHDGGAVNYAAVRARLANSLPEKANEIADFIDTLQEISRATMEMSTQISAHCAQ